MTSGEEDLPRRGGRAYCRGHRIAGIGFIASGRDQAVLTTQIDMRDNTIVLGGVEVDESIASKMLV